MATLRDLEKEMRDDIDELIEYNDLNWESGRNAIQRVRDEISETVESVVPTYIGGLLEVMEANGHLMHAIPENEPSDMSVYGIIRQVLFEHLEGIAHEHFDEVVDNFEEPEEEEEEEESESESTPSL